MSSFIRIMTAIFIIWAGVCLWHLWAASPIISLAHQDQERVIKKESHPNEPARIIALTTRRGTAEMAGERAVQKLLTNDDDWLKGLTIKVNNITGKKINFVSVRLTFVRPADDSTAGEAPLMHSLTYGHDPFHLKDLGLANQYNVPPGSTIDVLMSDDTHAMIKRVLKKLHYPPSIKQVDMLIEVVGFEDGTVWEMGKTLRRDPNDANKFIPIEEQAVVKKAEPRALLFLRKWSDGSSGPENFPLIRKASWVSAPSFPAQNTFANCGSSPISFEESCISDVAGCKVKGRESYENIYEYLRTHANTTAFKVCFKYNSQGQQVSPCSEVEEVAFVNEVITCPCPDSDGDGYHAQACGGTDCNDGNASLTPADADRDGYNPLHRRLPG